MFGILNEVFSLYNSFQRHIEECRYILYKNVFGILFLWCCTVWNVLKLMYDTYVIYKMITIVHGVHSTYLSSTGTHKNPLQYCVWTITLGRAFSIAVCVYRACRECFILLTDIPGRRVGIIFRFFKRFITERKFCLVCSVYANL